MPRTAQITSALLLLALSTQSPAQRPRITQPASARTGIEAQPQAGGGFGEIHAHWSARPGVSRFRFQLARDRNFSDIVVDRVVVVNEYHVAHLAPGEYFWRVAPLTRALGEFSAPTAVEASTKPATIAISTPTPEVKTRTIETPPRTTENTNTTATIDSTPRSPATHSTTLRSAGGWQAAIGNVAHPRLGHLRSAIAMDLVAMNSDGVVFALDAASGVTLWVTRTSATARVGVRAASNQFSPVLVPSAAGLDNVVVPFDGGVRAVQGATGKEMWRAPLPHSVTNGVALPLGNHTSALFLIDNTEPRLTVLDGSNGKVLAQSKLPARAFGLPVPLTYRGIQGVLIAFEDGRIEVRDKNATAVRAGNAGAAVTTPPLFVNGTRGLVLVGTRNGLTALDADDLRPLGRVVVKEDVPRGVLTAADLDGDGAPEVIMLTEGGQVVAVNAADGKIRWQQVGPVDAETATFVDLNADGALDVVVAGGQAFAIVLSGRDGSILWKAAEHPEFANHAASMAPRTLISSATGAGVLIVGSDPSGTNLRAVHLSSVAVQPINR